MKAILASILLLFATLGASAQRGLKGLIEAEKAFASFAAHNSVKQAFMLYADTAAVEFEAGHPLKSRPLWASRTVDNTVLKWQPQFAEIAESDDFGYTCGPWTYQLSQTDSVSARGQYTTIWHYIDGNWRFLLDIGTDYRRINSSTDVQEIKVKTKKIKGAGTSVILDLENAFIAACKKSVKEAYQQFLSSKSILNRQGFLPAVYSDDQAEIIEAIPNDIVFKVLDSGIASSGDLGFAYGMTTFNGRKDAYLHIWRHEKDGWKLAVDVLQH